MVYFSIIMVVYFSIIIYSPAVPYLNIELIRHPDNIAIHNIIGLYYSLHDNYPFIKKKAYKAMDRIIDLDPDYATKGYELYEDLKLSK